LLITAASINQQYFYKTGKGLTITGGRELGDSRGRRHSAGPGGHLSGKKIDINANHSFNNFLMNSPGFKQVQADFGDIGLYHSQSGTLWVLEGGPNGHWDVKLV